MRIALADSPPTQLGPFSGPDDTLREMVKLALGPRGEQSTMVRSMKDSIVRYLTPKDYLGEILAVRNFAHEKVRYSNDAAGVEQVQDPQRICEQIVSHGNAVGDCFPEGTLLLGEGHKFVRIEDVQVGDKIWGLDKWSTVEGKADKGLLPVTLITLNNGSVVPLTEDHKVYVLQCKEHGKQLGGDWELADPCACPLEMREEIRICVSQLKPHMVLVTPERIPFGVRYQRPELLRVKTVEHRVLNRPCWDIQTDDHRVYLPVHDVTVSNCDDIACFIGALARQLGRECEFVVVGFGRPGQYSHVFTRVKEPKTGKWIVCDPVAGTTEARMLSRVTTWKSVAVDL